MLLPENLDMKDPGGHGHSLTAQWPGMEIMHGTRFINSNWGTVSVITASDCQGYTHGLRREGPGPTKSHKGSLFVL